MVGGLIELIEMILRGDSAFFYLMGNNFLSISEDITNKLDH